MNLLKGTRCYLIGSMQYEDGSKWRLEIKKALSEMGIIVFNPYDKPYIDTVEEDNDAREILNHWMENKEYDKVAETVKRIRSDDLRLCDISDFLIVRINPQIASWGSAEELTTVNRMKKPIFMHVIGGKTLTPLWVMGMIPHKYIYDNQQEIIDTLKKIDSGEKPIDSDRWKLLKEEYR